VQVDIWSVYNKNCPEGLILAHIIQIRTLGVLHMKLKLDTINFLNKQIIVNIIYKYEEESINRAHMDIKRKTYDTRT
jgi:hypothetical protein